jgi:uncharacterized protein (TIGR00369 family)
MAREHPRSAAIQEALEAELLEAIHEIFAEKIPFNKVLGLRVMSLHHANPVLRFDMRPELVGNFLRGVLHGGVISSVLDVTGGMVAFLNLQRKLAHEPLESRIMRFERIGTIDLRVDYLRPGAGQWFESKGYVLRTGNKVAVARMELHSDAGEFIAAGTGAYVVA